jgi:hypothetical protein
MQSETGEPSGDGRIPFAFRIGVTGHREVDDPETLGRAIREALGRLNDFVAGSRGAELVPVVVSALAEGADRLVAEEVLAEKGARLEVALPLPREDYLDDFQQRGSKQEFQSLLERASDIWQAPAGLSREDAYERAGHYVVDRSDAVIALWDGEPARGRGGTAAIVAYARGRGVPLVWVKTKGDPAVVYELDTARASVIKDAARKLHEYNASVIKTAEFQLQGRALRERLMPDMTADMDTDPLGLSRDKVVDWLLPYFVRADVLGLRHQRRFRLSSWLIFVLAAAAVAVVAIQTNFLPGSNWLAGIEVVFLLVLLSILLVNRRWRLHDRWISCRFLAERLRSGYFLALAGTGDRRVRSVRVAYLSDSSEAWIERALTEVMARRPELATGPPKVALLRDYLNHYWIASQISYHKKAGFLQRRFDDRLIRATELLFLITLVAAFIHMLGIHFFRILGIDGHDSLEFWEKLLIVVSITVPAFGAAFHGIGTQRQFRHHSERYSRMADLLTQVHNEMAEATSLERVREVAAETEQIMREENSDWFGVMRFHDMELIMLPAQQAQSA